MLFIRRQYAGCCRAVAGAAPGPGSPRSALFSRAGLCLPPRRTAGPCSGCCSCLSSASAPPAAPCLPLPVPVLPAHSCRPPRAATWSSLSSELEAIKLGQCRACLGCNCQKTRQFLQHGGKNYCKQSCDLLVRLRQWVQARSCSFYPHTSRLPFPLLLFWWCLHKHC